MFFHRPGGVGGLGRAPSPDLRGRLPPGRWLVRTGGSSAWSCGCCRRIERDLEAFSTAGFEALAQKQGAFLRRFEGEFYARRERFVIRTPRPGRLCSPLIRPPRRSGRRCRSLSARWWSAPPEQAAIRALLESAGLSSLCWRVSSAPTRGIRWPSWRRPGIFRSARSFRRRLAAESRACGRDGSPVALAGWGYNTATEQARARELGIPVLQAGRILEGLRELAQS